MSETVRSWLIAFSVVSGALLAGGAIDAVLARLLGHETGPAHRVRGAIARAIRWQPEIWSVLLAIAV
ncbi:MAG: hypothetical protein P4L93_01730, partial [Coriobacteriia bacterium]|nr:hypothetical protein [Coriobacteriia bacterium]